MADEKNEILRDDYNRPNDKEANGSTTDHASDDRDDKAKNKQSDDTKIDDQSTDDEGNPKPVIYSEPVPYNERTTATPLAATAFARFDPGERNVQLAEHYTYTDEAYEKDGFL